jgi:predicted Zn-dependent protease
MVLAYTTEATMATNKNLFTIKKFDGDSDGSYAVFRKTDVKGRGSIIFWGEAQPVVCGLTRREAEYYRSRCDAQAAGK